MRLLPQSARTRRRLFRLGIVATIGAGLAIAALAIPNRSGWVAQHFRPGRPDLVKVEKQVPLAAADRAAINRLLDRFVVDAVGRRTPASAFELATPAMRAGTTRTQWKRGEVPVQPLEVRGSRFHGWNPATPSGTRSTSSCSCTRPRARAPRRSPTAWT